jgi:hypothetical protein
MRLILIIIAALAPSISAIADECPAVCVTDAECVACGSTLCVSISSFPGFEI